MSTPLKVELNCIYVVGFPCTMLDPLENGLLDVPDYEHTEDERFPPLPPPSSPGRGDVEEDPFGNAEGLFFILNHSKKLDVKG